MLEVIELYIYEKENVFCRRNWKIYDVVEEIVLLLKVNIYRVLFEFYVYIIKIFIVNLEGRYCNYYVL